MVSRLVNMTSRSQSPVFGIGKNGDIQDEMGNLEEPPIETFSPAYLCLLSSVWKSCLLRVTVQLCHGWVWIYSSSSASPWTESFTEWSVHSLNVFSWTPGREWSQLNLFSCGATVSNRRQSCEVWVSLPFQSQRLQRVNKAGTNSTVKTVSKCAEC